MTENIENNINETGGSPIREPERVRDVQTQQSNPNTPPSFANYGNTNQYMPYGTYMPYQKPEAPKTPSKGKKKGIVVAMAILVVSFLIALVVLFASFFADSSDAEKTTPQESDKTQLNFSETPSKSDGKDTAEGGELPANAIYKKVHESSVGIIVYSGNRQQISGEGSGVVIGPNGDGVGSYIVTCTHVVDVQNPKIVVQTADGTKYDAQIVGLDSKTDIGVIYVANASLKAAEFADSNSLEVGDTIYAIGNPGGTQFFGSFTNGMVSAIGRPVGSPVGYEVACIQHTAAINPGNSGGALVNGYGQIVGINSSKIASTDFEGMGFAVPSATVKEIVDQLIKDGRVTNRPALGIKFMTITQSQTYSTIVQANNLPEGSIVIDSIMNGSDLQNKGVKPGDMIIAVNGKDLDDHNIILDIIEKGKVGDVLTLEICRVDSSYKISTFEVQVKLVEDSSLSEQVVETETQTFPFPFGN